MPVESSQGWADGGDAGDEDWHDDVIWPAETDQGIPWAGAGGPAGTGWPGDHRRRDHDQHGRRPGMRGRGGPLASLIVVAVLAAGTGAGLTMALNGSSGTPAAATSTHDPGRASGRLPGGSSGRLPGGASGGGPGGGQGAQMLLIGTVTAVSATSITIGGNGPPVTAAVTASTRVTGQVGGISGIKVGDQVSAQLTQSGGRVIATAIQYPAEQPGGAGQP